MLQGKEYDCSELGFVDKYSKVQYVTDPSKIKILLMGIYLFTYLFFQVQRNLAAESLTMAAAPFIYELSLPSFIFQMRNLLRFPDNQMRIAEFVSSK